MTTYQKLYQACLKCSALVYQSKTHRWRQCKKNRWKGNFCSVHAEMAQRKEVPSQEVQCPQLEKNSDCTGLEAARARASTLEHEMEQQKLLADQLKQQKMMMEQQLAQRELLTDQLKERETKLEQQQREAIAQQERLLADKLKEQEKVLAEQIKQRERELEEELRKRESLLGQQLTRNEQELINRMKERERTMMEELTQREKTLAEEFERANFQTQKTWGERLVKYQLHRERVLEEIDRIRRQLAAIEKRIKH
jgi:hypothetical protein